MHVSIMESSALPPNPYDSITTQQMNELPAPIRAELAGRQSAYMTNMILPDIVKSSKNFPLGPDCIITYSEVPDQSVLLNVDLYWLISLEKGCVECKVLIHDSGAKKKAITHDPRVIITRKTRRFEAYCCGICKANFVTVVQALLHMKAFHRQTKKILIQDQNVFHDIEKAMEVPPVPLPWYVTKRAPDQGLQLLPARGNEGPPASVTVLGPANDGTNPVTCLLQAIVKEYGKQVHVVFFGKEFTDVTVQFEDKTSVLAHLPDLANRDMQNIAGINLDEKLDFRVHRVKSENENVEACVVRVNNPALAQHLITSALKQGVATGSGTDLAGQDDNALKHIDSDKVETKQVIIPERDDQPIGSPATQVKLDSRGRPRKTVRFMVGSPDSDEEGSSSASERTGGRDSISPNTSIIDKDTVSIDNTKDNNTEIKELPSDVKKTKEDEGLQGVVNQLISTASKGLITTVDPVSPVPTTITTSKTVAQESHSVTPTTRYLPKNLSVPNFPTMPVPTSVISNNQPAQLATSSSMALNPGMIRVQSWGGAVDPQRFALSTYTPNTPQNFDHMTTEELRRSMLSVGRGFTYAEKIKLMKKLNDEDSLITQEHVRGTGKLVDTETSTTSKQRILSSSSVSSMVAESSSMPTVTSVYSKMKLKKSESEPSFEIGNSRSLLSQPFDPRRKRKSKYDVDHFMQTGAQALDFNTRQKFERTAKKAKKVSNESSESDEDISETDSEQDRDDEPPSLLNVMRSSFPGGVPRSNIFTSQAQTSASFPSMLSSEYYGSGEWASTAMQTLQKLQMEASSSGETPTVKTENSPTIDLPSEDDSDSRSSSPFVNTSLINSLNAQTQSASEVPSLSSASMAENTVDAIMAIAKRITAEQSHIKQFPQSETKRARSQQRKRPLSPLLTHDEKEILRARVGPKVTDRLNKKVKKEKHSKISSKSSDSNLRKRSTSSESNNTKPSIVIAERGDSLEFTTTITGASVQKNDEISLKFCKNTLTESDSGLDATTDNSMGMPQLFQNSVETVMKVKYIEKLNMCRVCGYSLAAEENNAATMRAHVMEHSLKELLQAGCNGKSLA